MYNYLNVSAIPVTIQGVTVEPGECKEFPIAVNDPHMVITEKSIPIEVPKRTKSTTKSAKPQEPTEE